MKILVTGGAGFIGSAVVKRALAEGHSVVNVDCLTYAANLASLRSVEGNPDYVFEKQNICDEEAIKAIFVRHSPDVVLHLAAESHVDRSIDGPEDFISTNIIGTFNLLKTSRAYFDRLAPERQTAFRFHHVSTDEVYGDLEIDDAAFTETTRYNPSSPYSASKAASDHLVRAWGRTYGLPVILTNCSNNYGPYQFPEKLIPVVILKALHRKSIPVYGTGENIRDWLYVEDHADALLKVLKNGRLNETYNIGGNNERSNLDIVRTICAIVDDRSDDSFERRDLIEFVSDRPGHDKRYAIDATKIQDELGWTPSINFDDGFKRTVEWYLKNEKWWRPLIDANKFGQRLGLKESS